MKETKFKQTEVGMIPSDWEVFELSQLCDKIGDIDHRMPESMENGIPYIMTGDFIGQNELDFEKAKKVSQRDYEQLIKKIKPERGDIIFARYASIGAVRLIKTDTPFLVSYSCAVIKPKKKIDNEYLYFTFFSSYLQEQELLSINVGTQGNVGIDSLKKFLIAIPPSKEEQQRIANTLSDVDTLIANLEKLIAKKKNIKQGAMQQLLTGKKRLPGFGSDERTGTRLTDERRKECHSERSTKREESSGYKMTELGMIPSDWEVKKLGHLCSLWGRIGFRGYTREDLVEAHKGAITFSPSDIHNQKIDLENCTYISLKKYEESPEIKVFNGDIIFGKTASIGKCALVEGLSEKATINPQFVLMNNFKCNNRFLYYQLIDKPFQTNIWTICGGSTIPTMSQEKLKQQQIAFPSTYAEQTAIANVLSDMDTEISALETKLAKYRKLKTGMMQQLLTGKIRLV